MRRYRVYYVAIAYALLWWIWLCLLTPNPALDVLETVAWSAHPEWGYYKMPPLTTWLYSAVISVFGYHDWVLHLLPVTVIALALIVIWKTASRLLPAPQAAFASSLLTSVHVYNYSLGEFNNNILEILTWALASWAFVKAVLDKRLRDWFWLGMMAALTLYTKYASMLLLASMVIYSLTPPARALWKSKGPYIAIITALIAYIPHLHWLVTNDFISLHYMVRRTGLEAQPYQFLQAITRAGSLALSQILILLPMAITMAIARTPRTAIALPDSEKLVRTLAFTPFLLLFLYALLTGGKVKDMWATPCWNFLGIWLVMRFTPVLELSAMRRAGMALLVINILYLTAYAAAMRMGPDITGKIRREHFDGAGFAQSLEKLAQEKKSKQEIRILITDTWLGGNLHYHLASHPDNVTEGNPAFSPWVTQADINRHGAWIVWKDTVPGTLLAAFPAAQDMGKIQAGWQLGQGYQPLAVAVFYIPPTTP